MKEDVFFVFLCVKFGIQKSCLCKINDDYQVCLIAIAIVIMIVIEIVIIKTTKGTTTYMRWLPEQPLCRERIHGLHEGHDGLQQVYKNKYKYKHKYTDKSNIGCKFLHKCEIR